VVRAAQKFVPDFEAHESAIEGEVTTASAMPDIVGKTYVSRTNRPLVAEAMHMLRRGLIPNYLGRDFTTGLKLVLSRHRTPAALDAWLAQELAKAKTASRKATVHDRYETLQILLASGKADEVLRMLQENPKGHATLSTVHKFKGLEADHIILNLSCRFEDPQSSNVAYVGHTRAKKTLTVLDDAY